ncbi:M61 family metallopeptidase [Acidobacteria bacterium AB60]|nr:M61 family metallopeptidase [Acidobacteria bacterium AB60]
MDFASLVRRCVATISCSFVGIPVAPAQPAAKHAQVPREPIQITADLTDAPRRIFRAEIDLPVTSGPLTLTTPQWIPGTHMPIGPAAKIAGVVFTANGQTLPWRRDDVDLYQFHLNIPAGVTRLHAHLDSIVSDRVSDKLAMLDWEALLLYPAHVPVRDLPIQAAVIVPPGWGVGTALTLVAPRTTPVPDAGATTRFAATNVEQLEDSPILTGLYFREYPLAPEISPKHFLEVAADAADEAEFKPALLAEIANLVREADKEYASHHYNEYRFLLTISDTAGFSGTEHGQSSDDGAGDKAFSDPAMQPAVADLLPHEFTHSWNGKYRRPATLYQPDFATPQQGELLWVYEGMTQYLGNVLAARAGLKSAQEYRELLASSAAGMDYTPGRSWRSTQDTAIAASLLRNPDRYANWTRGQDYYMEGELLWLDIDTLIRKTTNNQKSLDDFERLFLGKGGNTGPTIVPYTFDELVAALNQVMPSDWAPFLHERVDKPHDHANFDGIARGGYDVVYQDEPSNSEKSLAALFPKFLGGVDAWFSIGMQMGTDGSINDVRWNGPAYKAGLAPGDKVLGVNGRLYNGDLLRAAIRDAKGKPEPIHLIVQRETFLRSVDIDYHDGERYPVLKRNAEPTAYLDDIIKPLASAPAATK